MTRWGVIDAGSIAEARALIGVPLRRDRMQWVEAATQDAVRQFCLGVGEDNPLFLDARYARRSRWQGLIAPPSFLYAVDATIVAPKMPGVQWIYAGTRWRFFDALRVGDTLDTTARLTAVEEKQGQRFGTWVLQTGEVEYARDGAMVAVAEGRIARTPRGKRPNESAGAPVRGSKTDLAAPARAAERAARRGAEPRLWESVSVGDRVGPVVRPLSLEDIYRWYAGAQGALHYGGAHGDAVRYRHRHDDYEINTETGAKDAAARGHFSAKLGKRVGMGGAYDVGPHRISWLVAMLTDWAGDDGFLAELSVDVLRPNLVGDTTRLSAMVTTTWQRDHALVALDVEGRNQDDILTTRGDAIVALPSSKGPVALPLLEGDRSRSLREDRRG
jgi:acyl dehydratase